MTPESLQARLHDAFQYAQEMYRVGEYQACLLRFHALQERLVRAGLWELFAFYTNQCDDLDLVAYHSLATENVVRVLVRISAAEYAIVLGRENQCQTTDADTAVYFLRRKMGAI